jgi:hypothetical protein
MAFRMVHKAHSLNGALSGAGQVHPMKNSYRLEIKLPANTQKAR